MIAKIWDRLKPESVYRPWTNGERVCGETLSLCIGLGLMERGCVEKHSSAPSQESPLCSAAALRFKPGSAVRHSSVTSRPYVTSRPHSTIPTSFLVPQFTFFTSRHVFRVTSSPHVPPTSRTVHYVTSLLHVKSRPPSRHVPQDYTSPSWPPFDPAHPACIPRRRLDAAGLGQQSDFESRTTWTAARLGETRTAEQFGHQCALRCATQQGTKSRLAPLCGVRKATNHGWLRCAAQQCSELLLAPLCGAAGLRVTAGSAVRRSRAPSHCWLRSAAQQGSDSLLATMCVASRHAAPEASRHATAEAVG